MKRPRWFYFVTAVGDDARSAWLNLAHVMSVDEVGEGCNVLVAKLTDGSERYIAAIEDVDALRALLAQEATGA